jgi:hypothetical protein
MSDTSKSVFPKMGEYPLEDGSFVNMSGNRSAYTMPVAKKGPSGDDIDGPTAHRGVGSLATGETNGPKFAPQTKICFTNDPVAHGTGRGMRTVPSSMGDQDFWSDRSASQSGEVIVP